MTARGPGSGKVGLALAGGGPQGSIYEIGAVRALDEALEGLDFNHLHIYVGVSAGAFISACLANELSTAQMCRAIIKQEPGEHPFVPETFLTPSVGALLRGGIKLPGLAAQALWDFASSPIERRLLGSFTRLSRALPVGVFKNEPIRRYLHKIFSRPGRSDDFRRLSCTLVLVATDLDSGQPVRFGEPGLDHVPISTAVQASTALPGLYPPVQIDGRYYVDGVLRKTVHASVALEQGVDLLLCVNPIVPVDTRRTVELGVMRRGNLVDRGLPTVLSQTFRTIVHSRMSVGMAAYERRFEDQEVLVFEPSSEDYEIFFTNIFSFAKRKQVCEHAYRCTRRQLWHDRERVAAAAERVGARLRIDVLEEEDRDLWRTVELDRKRSPKWSVSARLERALTRVEQLVQERSDQRTR